jgi:hypothetical protein
MRKERRRSRVARAAGTRARVMARFQPGSFSSSFCIGERRPGTRLSRIEDTSAIAREHTANLAAAPIVGQVKPRSVQKLESRVAARIQLRRSWSLVL